MKQYFRLILLLATCAAALSSSAKAQDSEPRDSTVQEVIAACDSTDPVRTEQCDREFAATLVAAAMEADSPPPDKQVCLPDFQDGDAIMVAFKKDMLSWLRMHPEVQSQSFTEGSFKAFQALYVCKK